MLNDWAKILNVGAATLNRYLFKERGDMKINEVLELCNIIGHGGGGQHPIVISQDMLEKRLPDKLVRESKR